MSEEQTKELIEDEEIDLSTVTNLKDQKKYCKKMLKVLELEEKRLRKRFIGTQTLSDFVDADAELKVDVSQFVGYNYGSINQCMVLVDSAVLNLRKFREGAFDEVDKGARGMFISLWYNLGLANVDSVDELMSDLEGLEKDLFEKFSEQTGEDECLVLKRGVIH